MTRLLALMRLDVRLQRRYGLYYAAAFVMLVWIILLRQLPGEALPVAVPFAVFADLAIFGFFFIAGAVLFEKGERTLAALVVTPARFGEYLASKLATLTLLALAISLVVTLVTFGPGFSAPLFLTGVMLTSLISLLVGFIAVAPFKSISDFFIASQFYMPILALPLIPFSGWWDNPVFYLVPTHGSLLLVGGAFRSVADWQVVYALLYGLLWVAGLTWLSRRAFDRYILARVGGG